MVVNMKRFALIPEEEKITITQKEGTYLTVRAHEQFFIELYAIKNFFVEIWYSMNKQPQRVKTRMFKSSSHLDIYLNDEVSFSLLQWVST